MSYMDDHGQSYSATIIRRHRGVYLASYTEHVDGIEDFDAYPTLAQAKRWVAQETGLGRRLRWEPDGENIWHATWETP